MRVVMLTKYGGRISNILYANLNCKLNMNEKLFTTLIDKNSHADSVQFVNKEIEDQQKMFQSKAPLVNITSAVENGAVYILF